MTMLLNTTNRRRLILLTSVLLMVGAVCFISLNSNQSSKGIQRLPMKAFNQCQSSPCLNGAVCSNYVTHFVCDCEEGYTGKLCQFVDISTLTRRTVAVETSNHGDVKQPAFSSKKKYGVPITGVNYTIIYNKIPKCGSRSMDFMLERQAYRLHIPREQIVVLSNMQSDSAAVKEKEKQANSYVAFLSAHPPALYSDHFFYTPIEHKSDSVVYINMMRDPIDQFVSLYYFLQHGDNTFGSQSLKTLRKMYLGSLALNETLDDCILLGRQGCEADSKWFNYYFIPFFCGSHPKCNEQSEWALAEAKRRVEEEYLVVGLLEDFEGSVRVMEKLAPSLFNGLVNDCLELKESLGGKEPEWYRTRHKTPPSAEVHEILRQRLDYTYQFYDFVKAKFERLKGDLGID